MATINPSAGSSWIRSAVYLLFTVCAVALVVTLGAVTQWWVAFLIGTTVFGIAAAIAYTHQD